MYPQTNLINSHRIPMNKSRSSILKCQPSISSLNTNSHPLTNLTNKTKRKIEEYESNLVEYDVPTTNYASLRKQQQQTQTQTSTNKRLKSDQLNTPKKKLSSEDNSLRIVTSTVQGMKHWTNKHLPYPILFEVFGKLDSQVTYIPSTYSRQFSLIDTKDRIECLFTEIDQTFSNIERDVQLRIICRMDSIRNLAHCLTIRVANKDEWHEKHAIIKQCDIQLNEDDHSTKKSKNKFKK